METSSDCLVLRIIDIDSMKYDNTAELFILFDTNMGEYIIRGSNAHVKEFVPFSFNCRYRAELIEFIKFFLCVKNKWTYELYNYDNLPADSNDITYEFLSENIDNRYNIVSYDKSKYNKKDIKKWLRVLQYVRNEY
jgi:hypothetical protein